MWLVPVNMCVCEVVVVVSLTSWDGKAFLVRRGEDTTFVARYSMNVSPESLSRLMPALSVLGDDSPRPFNLDAILDRRDESGCNVG